MAAHGRSIMLAGDSRGDLRLGPEVSLPMAGTASAAAGGTNATRPLPIPTALDIPKTIVRADRLPELRAKMDGIVPQW